MFDVTFTFFSFFKFVNSLFFVRKMSVKQKNFTWNELKCNVRRSEITFEVIHFWTWNTQTANKGCHFFFCLEKDWFYKVTTTTTTKKEKKRIYMITRQPDQITSPGQTKRNRNRKCHRTLPVVPVMMMVVVNRIFNEKILIWKINFNTQKRIITKKLVQKKI